jgi:hypothetical protein
MKTFTKSTPIIELQSKTCFQHDSKPEYFCLEPSCIDNKTYALCHICYEQHQPDHRPFHHSTLCTRQLSHNVQDLLEKTLDLQAKFFRKDIGITKQIDMVYAQLETELLTILKASKIKIKNVLLGYDKEEGLRKLNRLKGKVDELFNHCSDSTIDAQGYLKTWSRLHQDYKRNLSGMPANVNDIEVNAIKYIETLTDQSKTLIASCQQFAVQLENIITISPSFTTLEEIARSSYRASPTKSPGTTYNAGNGGSGAKAQEETIRIIISPAKEEGSAEKKITNSMAISPVLKDYTITSNLITTNTNTNPVHQTSPHQVHPSTASFIPSYEFKPQPVEQLASPMSGLHNSMLSDKVTFHEDVKQDTRTNSKSKDGASINIVESTIVTEERPVYDSYAFDANTPPNYSGQEKIKLASPEPPGRLWREAISEFPSTNKAGSPQRQSFTNRAENSNPFGEAHKIHYYEKMTMSEQPKSRGESPTKPQNLYMTMSMDKASTMNENYQFTETITEEKITTVRNPFTESL